MTKTVPEAGSQSATPPRTLPVLTGLNTFFWTAGSRGRLEILRCNACDEWIHPPLPVCPSCLSRDIAPRAVSGFATVETLTINYQAWVAEMTVPYVVALVSLDDCPGVRLTTNVVGCKPDAVSIGDAVRVVFEQHGDVWRPLFTPV
jgi:uncharacterized OB-fold protein